MKTIPLTNSEAVVLVSDEDYKRVSQYKWFLKRAKGRPGTTDKYYYAARSQRIGKKVKTVWLHRFLSNEPDGDVHHADGDKLNCQQDNLEPIDHDIHGQRYRGAEQIDNDNVPF
jgi:hypothetical protein